MKKQIQLSLFFLIVSASLSAQLTKAWSFKTEGRIFASAISDDEKIYIGSGDGLFYALDKQSGEIIWSFQTASTKSSTAVLVGNLVCFGTNDGVLYALDKKKGTRVWKHQTGGEQELDMWDYYLSTPVVSDGVLYWGCGDTFVYALDPVTGEEKWKYKTDGIVHATPVVDNNKLFVGSFDGHMYALNASSGDLLWKFKTLGAHYFPKGEVQKAPLVADGVVYFGTRDYNLYALDAKSGRTLWNYREPHGWIIATPTLQDGHLYFGLSDGHQFCCMNVQSGAMKWTLPLNMRVFGEAIPVGDKLIFGSHNGILYLVNAADGKIRDHFKTAGCIKNSSEVFDESGAFKKGFELYGSDMVGAEQKILNLGSILSTPLVEGDRIYFGSTDGYVYAVEYTGDK